MLNFHIVIFSVLLLNYIDNIDQLDQLYIILIRSYCVAKIPLLVYILLPCFFTFKVHLIDHLTPCHLKK